MPAVLDPPEAILATLEANDRERILRQSALHPKLRAKGGKPPPEVLMELLDELDTELKASEKRINDQMLLL